MRDIEYRLTCAARILFAAKSVPAECGMQLSENGREPDWRVREGGRLGDERDGRTGRGGGWGESETGLGRAC